MTADDRGLEYPRASFAEPTPYGYLYVGIRSDPPRRLPLVRRSRRRAERIRACVRIAERLDTLADVVAVAVYEAVVIPPVAGSPRFDVVVLVTTTSPATTASVETTDAFRQLDADLVMAARNVRRIGDTERPGTGTFLFNHFTAEEPERALRTWEDITGWFTHEAGVDNSTLLQAVGAAPYVLVNHVRLPTGPIRFLLRFARPSFHGFVRARLTASGTGNAPVVCRPVHRTPAGQPPDAPEPPGP